MMIAHGSVVSSGSGLTGGRSSRVHPLGVGGDRLEASAEVLQFDANVGRVYGLGRLVSFAHYTPDSVSCGSPTERRDRSSGISVRFRHYPSEVDGLTHLPIPRVHRKYLSPSLFVREADAKVFVEASLTETGVISPYRAQAGRIRHRLETDAVTVNTIDAIRGERRVIPISLVWSNQTGGIGFLGVPEYAPDG